MPLTAVAVFGGTFDPVHHGHLRSALELVEHLSVDQIRLMPCCSPPHRGMPAAAAEHRAAMVQLAVAREEKLICDRRELERSGKSYSIDSLIELHEELGAGCSLSLVMGCDAVQSVESWHRWQELLVGSFPRQERWLDGYLSIAATITGCCSASEVGAYWSRSCGPWRFPQQKYADCCKMTCQSAIYYPSLCSIIFNYTSYINEVTPETGR